MLVRQTEKIVIKFGGLFNFLKSAIGLQGKELMYLGVVREVLCLDQSLETEAISRCMMEGRVIGTSTTEGGISGRRWTTAGLGGEEEFECLV